MSFTRLQDARRGSGREEQLPGNPVAYAPLVWCKRYGFTTIQAARTPLLSKEGRMLQAHNVYITQNSRTGLLFLPEEQSRGEASGQLFFVYLRCRHEVYFLHFG